MNEQVNKLLGLISLLIVGIIGLIFRLLFNVLPAIVLCFFFGAILAGLTHTMTYGHIAFRYVWLTWTGIIFIGVHFNFKKAEAKMVKADRELGRDLDKNK